MLEVMIDAAEEFEKETISKQALIEQSIDKHTGQMGRELIALLSLHARKVVSGWKSNSFIRQFANSIGLVFSRDLLYVDVAVRILTYTYPRNRAVWDIQDKRFENIVKGSAWFRANEKGGK